MIFSALSLANNPLNAVKLAFYRGDEPDVPTAVSPRLVPTPVATLTLPSQGQAQPQIALVDIPLTANPDQQLAQRQQQSVQHATQEWQKGVRESSGTNRSPRINQYARAAQFGPGYAWCGFFVGFNYAQAGFTQAPHLASSVKARDFFLYRSLTDRSKAKNQQLEQLQQQQKQAGSTRQYFMLKGSADAQYIKSNPNRFAHITLETYAPQNLPIRPGDTALFTRGHVGLVTDYNPQTGVLKTIEGNTSGLGPNGKTWHQAVVRNEYNLKDPTVQKQFGGFGRPALADFKSEQIA